jgi:hypothetical protein
MTESHTPSRAASAGDADGLFHLSADVIDRCFAELSKSASVLRRRELVERIAARISLFMMIDEEILRPSLIESLKNWREDEALPSSTFYL